MHEPANLFPFIFIFDPSLPQQLCHASRQLQLERSPVTEGSYQNESILS